MGRQTNKEVFMTTCAEMYNGISDGLSTICTFSKHEPLLGDLAEKVDSAVQYVLQAIDPKTYEGYSMIEEMKKEQISRNSHMTYPEAQKMLIESVTAMSAMIFILDGIWPTPKICLALAVITVLYGAIAYGTVCRAQERAIQEMRQQ